MAISVLPIGRWAVTLSEIRTSRIYGPWTVIHLTQFAWVQGRLKLFFSVIRTFIYYCPYCIKGCYSLNDICQTHSTFYERNNLSDSFPSRLGVDDVFTILGIVFKTWDFLLRHVCNKNDKQMSIYNFLSVFEPEVIPNLVII